MMMMMMRIKFFLFVNFFSGREGCLGFVQMIGGRGGLSKLEKMGGI